VDIILRKGKLVGILLVEIREDLLDFGHTMV
jgi:hypothetical protein